MVALNNGKLEKGGDLEVGTSIGMRIEMGTGGRRRTGRDTLDAATTGETTDGGFGDTLDVVTEDFAVAFGAAFAETFSSLATCGESDVSFRVL